MRVYDSDGITKEKYSEKRCRRDGLEEWWLSGILSHNRRKPTNAVARGKGKVEGQENLEYCLCEDEGNARMDRLCCKRIFLCSRSYAPADM